MAGPSGLIPQPGPIAPAPVHSPVYHLDVGSLQQLVRTIGVVWAIGVAGLFAFALHSAGAPAGQSSQPVRSVTEAQHVGAPGDSGTAGALREVGATLSAYLSELASQRPAGNSQAAGTSPPPSGNLLSPPTPAPPRRLPHNRF